MFTKVNMLSGYAIASSLSSRVPMVRTGILYFASRSSPSNPYVRVQHGRRSVWLRGSFLERKLTILSKISIVCGGCGDGRVEKSRADDVEYIDYWIG